MRQQHLSACGKCRHRVKFCRPTNLDAAATYLFISPISKYVDPDRTAFRRSDKTTYKENSTMQQVLTRMRRGITAGFVGAAAAVALSAQSATTTVSESPGSSSRTTTVTGANGKTATYQNNAAWGNGAYTDSRSVTGFNGKTANSTTSASYTPGSTSRQTAVTGFNGRSATYDNNRSWGNGTYSDTKNYRGVNGATRSDTVSRSGGIVSNTFTGRNGNSRTVARFARYRR